MNEMTTDAFRGVIAVIRTSSLTHVEPVIDTLVSAGVDRIELTLTSPGAIEFLTTAKRRWQGAARIGMGTVLSTADATAAIEAGADFLVTPTVRTEVAAVATAHGTPLAMGALTPTEVMQALELGADVVKIFPASTVGAEYLRHLRGPLPQLQAVPSGGVDIDDIPAWLAAGAIGVSLGGPMLGDALSTGDVGALAARAAGAVSAFSGGAAR